MIPVLGPGPAVKFVAIAAIFATLAAAIWTPRVNAFTIVAVVALFAPIVTNIRLMIPATPVPEAASVSFTDLMMLAVLTSELAAIVLRYEAMVETDGTAAGGVAAIETANEVTVEIVTAAASDAAATL